MSLENENNPVPSEISGNLDPDPKIKKKGGRPKGSKNKGGRPRESGIALRQQRKYEISLQEAIRQGLHPDIVLEYYKTILKGQTPLLETRNGIDYIIPDPNPLTPAPTLEQRNQAMKALADRGYGLPAQSIQIDAEYKKTIELQLTGISENLLKSQGLEALYTIAKALQIPNSSEIIDAEIVENPQLPAGSE